MRSMCVGVAETESAAKVKKRKGFLFSLLPSPRGDQCEQSAPTVRLQLSHGYRFKTLKRRLGFTAVSCQAMANLAVGVWVRVWVRT